VGSPLPLYLFRAGFVLEAVSGLGAVSIPFMGELLVPFHILLSGGGAAPPVHDGGGEA